jgi:hypothetical protein
MAIAVTATQAKTAALTTALSEVVVTGHASDLYIMPASGATLRLFTTGSDGGGAGSDYIPIPSGGLNVPAKTRILLATQSGNHNVHLWAV